MAFVKLGTHVHITFADGYTMTFRLDSKHTHAGMTPTSELMSPEVEGGDRGGRTGGSGSSDNSDPGTGSGGGGPDGTSGGSGGGGESGGPSGGGGVIAGGEEWCFEQEGYPTYCWIE